LGEPAELAKLWLFTKAILIYRRVMMPPFDWGKGRGPLDTRIHTLSDYPLLIGEILRLMEHLRISMTGIGLPLFFAPIFLNLTGALFNLRFQDD
jgi:hypothetical protein